MFIHCNYFPTWLWILHDIYRDEFSHSKCASHDRANSAPTFFLTAPVKICFCQAADASWHQLTPAMIYLWAAACFHVPWSRLCKSKRADWFIKAFEHFRKAMCYLESVELLSFYGFMKRPWIQGAPVCFFSTCTHEEELLKRAKDTDFRLIPVSKKWTEIINRMWRSYSFDIMMSVCVELQRLCIYRSDPVQLHTSTAHGAKQTELHAKKKTRSLLLFLKKCNS